jgi:hypothetical protein
MRVAQAKTAAMPTMSQMASFSDPNQRSASRARASDPGVESFLVGKSGIGLSRFFQLK